MEKRKISVDQVEEDLDYLAGTDLQHAQEKTEVQRKEYAYKKIKQICFLQASGTIAEKTALADVHDKTAAAHELYCAALEQSLSTENNRKTAQLRIDVWRSLNKALREGNI